MVLRQNPFKARTSEATASDQVFLSNFAPGILRTLPVEIGPGKTHLITSPPGGGKTTLLRLLTPGVLTALSRQTSAHQNLLETRRELDRLGAMGDDGPAVMGVMLTCASGYADLTSLGRQSNLEGRFRALFNARVVLRSLNAVRVLSELTAPDALASVSITTEPDEEFRYIPSTMDGDSLYNWAVELENDVFSAVDALGPVSDEEVPGHATFESARWLSAARFFVDGRECRWKPVLLIDDLHWLARDQRSLLLHELINGRHPISIWMAERLIATDPNDLLAHGARQGRDYECHDIREIWDNPRSSAFNKFAQQVIERRVPDEDEATNGDFGACLDSRINDAKTKALLEKARAGLLREVEDLSERNRRYKEWASKTLESASASFEGLKALQTELISIGRDEANPQQTLDILPAEPKAYEKIPSDVEGASEVFLSKHHDVPIYYGLERVMALSTSNIEEFLAICAQLYEGLLAKAIQRKNRQLEPQEQHRIIKEWANTRYSEIERTLSFGQQATILLDQIAKYCVDRTFLPNAPYAPGVTGVGITEEEFRQLTNPDATKSDTQLRNVLAECIAENLIVVRSLNQGYKERRVLYLNRLICARYGLTYRFGGWQSVALETLKNWMNGKRQKRSASAKE